MSHPSLSNLPNEITSNIVTNLDIAEVFSLSLTCRHLCNFIRDDTVCRHVLEVMRTTTRPLLFRPLGMAHPACVSLLTPAT